MRTDGRMHGQTGVTKIIQDIMRTRLMIHRQWSRTRDLNCSYTFLYPTHIRFRSRGSLGSLVIHPAFIQTDHSSRSGAEIRQSWTHSCFIRSLQWLLICDVVRSQFCLLLVIYAVRSRYVTSYMLKACHISFLLGTRYCLQCAVAYVEL